MKSITNKITVITMVLGARVFVSAPAIAAPEQCAVTWSEHLNFWGCADGYQNTVNASYDIYETKWRGWGWTENSQLNWLNPTNSAEWARLQEPYCRMMMGPWLTEYLADQAPESDVLRQGRNKLRGAGYPIAPMCDYKSFAKGTWSNTKDAVAGTVAAAFVVGGPIGAALAGIGMHLDSSTPSLKLGIFALQNKPAGLLSTLHHERHHFEGAMYSTNNCPAGAMADKAPRSFDDVEFLLNTPAEFVRGNINFMCDDSVSSGGSYGYEVQYLEGILASPPPVRLVPCIEGGHSHMCTADYTYTRGPANQGLRQNGLWVDTRNYDIISDTVLDVNQTLSSMFKEDPGYRHEDPALTMLLHSLASVGLDELQVNGPGEMFLARRAAPDDFCWLSALQGRFEELDDYVTIVRDGVNRPTLKSGMGPGTTAKALCRSGGNAVEYSAEAAWNTTTLVLPETTMGRVCLLTSVRGNMDNGDVATVEPTADGFSWQIRVTSSSKGLSVSAVCADGVSSIRHGLNGGSDTWLTSDAPMWCGLGGIANDFAGDQEAFEVRKQQPGGDSSASWYFGSKNGRPDGDAGGRVYGVAQCWRY